MGLFTQRPEEPSEWAGLPAEPHRRGGAADELPDEPQPSAGSVDLLFGAPTATTAYLEVPVSEPDAHGAADDGD